MVSSPSVAAPPRRQLAITPASVILVCVSALLAIGMAVLYSASSRAVGGATGYLYKQLIFLALAIGGGWLMARIDLEQLRKFAWVIGLVAGVGLLLVLIPHIGINVKGSRRWLGFGGIRLQVSEFAKLAMVFCVSHYLAVNQNKLHDFVKGFVTPCAIIGGFAVLILAEPDFGTALLTGAIGVGLLFLAGGRLLFLLPSVALALMGFGLLVLNNPNRMRRILAFLDPEGSRAEGGYQLWQSLLAFAAGGIDGVGLGNGRQQQSFLPEAHTDFIFAILGEEMGLITTLLVVGLFVAIFIAGLMHVRRAPNLFQFLVVTGSLLLICLQAIINLSVVTGMMPTKGISLPFISAGGSNLLLMGLLVGIIINSARTWTRPRPLERKRALAEVVA